MAGPLGNIVNSELWVTQDLHVNSLFTDSLESDPLNLNGLVQSNNTLEHPGTLTVHKLDTTSADAVGGVVVKKNGIFGKVTTQKVTRLDLPEYAKNFANKEYVDQELGVVPIPTGRVAYKGPGVRDIVGSSNFSFDGNNLNVGGRVGGIVTTDTGSDVVSLDYLNQWFKECQGVGPVYTEYPATVSPLPIVGMAPETGVATVFLLNINETLYIIESVKSADLSSWTATVSSVGEFIPGRKITVDSLTGQVLYQSLEPIRASFSLFYTCNPIPLESPSVLASYTGKNAFKVCVVISGTSYTVYGYRKGTEWKSNYRYFSSTSQGTTLGGKLTLLQNGNLQVVGPYTGQVHVKDIVSLDSGTESIWFATQSELPFHTSLVDGFYLFGYFTAGDSTTVTKACIVEIYAVYTTEWKLNVRYFGDKIVSFTSIGAQLLYTASADLNVSFITSTLTPPTLCTKRGGTEVSFITENTLVGTGCSYSNETLQVPGDIHCDTVLDSVETSLTSGLNTTTIQVPHSTVLYICTTLDTEEESLSTVTVIGNVVNTVSVGDATGAVFTLNSGRLLEITVPVSGSAVIRITSLS